MATTTIMTTPVLIVSHHLPRAILKPIFFNFTQSMFSTNFPSTFKFPAYVTTVGKTTTALTGVSSTLRSREDFGECNKECTAHGQLQVDRFLRLRVTGLA